MGTVLSADGTAIGFEAWGEGPPLIMIDGATAYRAMSQTAAQVGALLQDDFRTYAYDRRGRGESGDTPPYAGAARDRGRGLPDRRGRPTTSSDSTRPWPRAVPATRWSCS